MEYRNIKQIETRARALAPVSEEDIGQPTSLLEGVRDAADLIENLTQPFDNEVDCSKMSITVDGDKK